jgi:geranylgeranyl reductase family protein
MKKIYDAIVIGAGPVGCFVALVLSKLGMKPIVFEEHKEIGKPDHCAGHLSIKSLKSLGLYPLPKNIIENEFAKATFYSFDGFSFPVYLSKPVTCVVNRELFDKFIFNKAKAAGAVFYMNSRVKSLIIQNGCVCGVNVIKNGTEYFFKSKIIIDAEGISSRLIKQTNLAPLNPKELVYAVNAKVINLKNLRYDGVHVFFGKSYAPGFYAWLIPKLDGSANIGLATNSGNPNDYLYRLMRNHPIASKYLHESQIISKEFHAIPLGGTIPQFFQEGFLALGDVASQVKPTTGGGVIYGLRSAIIAGETANEAIDRNNFSSKFLKIYQDRYLKTFKLDFKVMQKIRSFLNSISDQKISKLLRFCRKIGLNSTLKNIDEIDLQGRTLYKTAMKPKIFVALIYLLINYIFANVLNLE